VTDHILNHGYHLVDKDGKPTTWGEWSPEKLNGDPKWWAERGLGSLEMLSHLKVAAHIVGETALRTGVSGTDSKASLCSQHTQRQVARRSQS
jgi:hypothetical protein